MNWRSSAAATWAGWWIVRLAWRKKRVRLDVDRDTLSRMRWMVVATGLLWFGMQAVPPPVDLVRVAGVDAESGIAYALISLNGVRVEGTQMPAPRLTAQCTRTAAGKLKFEVLADFGGAAPVVFLPPWRARSSKDFPPQLAKATVTMEFLGYTRVKPVKRQWVTPDGLPDEYQYATPGASSPDMEEFRFYLQYLRALPRLRLSVANRGTAEWETAGWQRALHEEPLCAAGGL